jgi:hypothetical protein
MAFVVSWGRGGQREITAAQELDPLLEEAAEQARTSGPVVVSIYRHDDGHWVGMDIGVGHPERSFAFYNDTGGGYGFEASLELWADDIVFDYGGAPTEYHAEETRVRPAAALHAAREYVATGRRLTCLLWSEE